ncbi:MAG TPA: deoxyribodipyrimidine photo-lyase [Phycisphaerales bacterium]|nr:deoxyribodipyrimidine photo-lyase [Phycisphaerales bacterium]
MTRSLVWFRRDLRTRDNTALHEAARAATRGVVGTFVICPEQWRNHDDAPVKIHFWLRNLRALSISLSRLNIPLVIVHAERASEIPERLLALARASRCDSLFWNHEYEVDEQRRDAGVFQRLHSAGMSVKGFHDHVLLDPESIRTDEGRCYSVFTPFKRRVIQRLMERTPEVLPEPAVQPVIEVQPTPIPDRVDGFDSPVDPSHWPAGEQAALGRLAEFCKRRVVAYRDDRDAPAIDGTSRLSPYLGAGVLSPRQCLAAARRANSGRLDGLKPGTDGPAQWISELIWREFYQHIVVGFPRVCMSRPFKPHTERIRWAENAEHFKRWCEGRTGVPIVDAGMRQLNAIGWMHNRLRMIVAMYLTKDLFLDWRLGERYFMRHLVDGDLGSNNGGWQWSASTGCDAAPYFRIFNPITQSEKVDPSGEFIRRWVPELAGVQGKAIHDPSRLGMLGRLRSEYSEPLVAREGVRERVIRAFRALDGR